MLKQIAHEIGVRQRAFSLAEMLVVLMIITFLILALPPIVHKKYVKRVSRGEHGRYECWKDPQTGELKEYYATERAGVIKGGTVDNPVGETVEQCRFKASTMAPNAAYFAFQVIGGGAGGSYPIYDASSTVYKNPAYEEKADVHMNMLCCKDGYSDKTNFGFCRGDNGYVWNDETYDICFNYEGSLSYWAQKVQTRDWILRYWIPVANDREIEICSGNGSTGIPNAGGTGGTVIRYGGKGGDGICAKLAVGGVKLGSDNRMKFVYGRNDHTSYYTVDEAVPTHQYYNKYFVKISTPSSIKPPYPSEYKGSWEFPEQGENDITVNDEYLWSPGGKYSWAQLPDNSVSTGSYYYDGGNDLTTEKNANNNVTVTIEGDSSVNNEVGYCELLAGSNGVDAEAIQGASLTSWEDQTRFNNIEQPDGTILPSTRGANAVFDAEKCPAPWVAGELNSYPATNLDDGFLIKKENRIQMPKSYVGNPKASAKERESERWFAVFTESYDFLNSSGFSRNGAANPFFPPRIDVSYTFGYDTPTFGYAGTPASSLSTFLSDLPDELTFELGAGGAPAESASVAAGNGGDTIIKSGDGTILMTAKGGSARPGGEAAAKIKMFGLNTCENLPADQKIDGCLDAGVAVYNEDNKMRFAVDSGFYTILELNSDSKTPSAIYNLYSKMDPSGSGVYLPMPGTAGDGGYSFIRNANGSETIKYSGYISEAQKNATIPLTVSFPDGDHTYNVEFSDGKATLVINHSASGNSSGFVSSGDYKCYKRYDRLGFPSGEVVTGETSTVCKPGQGYPGAVVIVW